jgi:hypothetical protein
VLRDASVSGKQTFTRLKVDQSSVVYDRTADQFGHSGFWGLGYFRGRENLK